MSAEFDAVVAAFEAAAGCTRTEAEDALLASIPLAHVTIEHLGCTEDEAVASAAWLALVWRRPDPPRPHAKGTGRERRALDISRQIIAAAIGGGDPLRMALADILKHEADRRRPLGGRRPGRVAALLWPELAHHCALLGLPVTRRRDGAFVDFVVAAHRVMGLPPPRIETLRSAAPRLRRDAEWRLGVQARLGALRGAYGA